MACSGFWLVSDPPGDDTVGETGGVRGGWCVSFVTLWAGFDTLEGTGFVQGGWIQTIRKKVIKNSQMRDLTILALDGIVCLALRENEC